MDPKRNPSRYYWRVIKPFAEAIYYQHKGDKEQATQIFSSIISDIKNTPFKEDAYINLARYQDIDFISISDSLNLFLLTQQNVSQRERLMWERATAADEALTIEHINSSNSTNRITIETVVRYYEELLSDYPQSFYAPYIRKRLSDLSKPSSS